MTRANIWSQGLFVLSLCFVQAAQAQMPAFPELTVEMVIDNGQGKGKGEKPLERAMSPELSAIASAKQLEEAGLKSGKLSGAVSSVCKSGIKSKADLEWICQNGSPAGRLYAAALIKRFDKKSGQQAFKVIAASDIKDVNVDFVGLKERCHYSVGDIVTDQISGKPLIEIVIGTI